MKIRLGTRGSRLALAQTERVAEQLRSAHPGIGIEIVILQSTGDRILDAPLSGIGGKGVFTNEIELAILDGRIDAAVHSLKDLPTTLPDGLAIAAVTRREDWRDVLVSARPMNWKELPSGTRVGTSSLRRRAELLRGNPGLTVLELRGNVPTRVKRMIDGGYDAIVLAAAGLARLGESVPYIHFFEAEDFLPAPGQGAVAVECRENDEELRHMLAAIAHAETALHVTAERAALAALGGGCQVPLGAVATPHPQGMLLRVRVLSPDGHICLDDSAIGPLDSPVKLGESLAIRLRDKGAERLLSGIVDDFSAYDAVVRSAHALDQKALGGIRAIVTRDEDTDGPLSRAIKALGGLPLCLPTVEHHTIHDTETLAKVTESARLYDWLILTSARAVAALRDSGFDYKSYEGKIAAVGEPTARGIVAAGGTVSLVAPLGTGASLQEALLTDAPRDASWLYPRSDRSDPSFSRVLREHGFRIDDPIVYVTGENPTATRLAPLFAGQKADAILFCSPSAVESFVHGIDAETRAGLLSGMIVGSMGPRTSEALRAARIPMDFEPTLRSFEGLAEALATAILAKKENS